MIRESVSVNKNSISCAWFEVFQKLLSPGIKSIIPLMVTINVDTNIPLETKKFRETLDGVLIQKEIPTSGTTANLIFPRSLWNPASTRNQLFSRYQRILPEIKRLDQRNRHGLYFERLSMFGSDKKSHSTGFNQLDHIIRTYRQGNTRRSALQASVFDPFKDHTNQKQRGFPCLQHVFFTPLDEQKLALTAVYATQYIFDRAYGNYLGLYNLGQFMAHEMNLTLCQIHCMAAQVKLGSISKEEGRTLETQLNTLSEQGLLG